MGRLTAGGASAALVVAIAASLAAPIGRVAGFDRFGELSATAVFDEELSFEVELIGEPPDELDLLLRFADTDVTFVQPVEPRGQEARFEWDVAEDYVTPNTPIHYRWRATDGESVTLSREQTILYDDDRPEIDWQTFETAEARVHWYGDAGDLAERFGGVVTGAVQRAEVLLGVELAEPVDIFAYESEQDFFGALDLGPREWVGGQASSEIRSIYIRLDAGPESYMEPLLIHEVTHIVFDDAVENPYHSPPHWFNEGFAVWAENQDASQVRGMVEDAAAAGQLMSFEAIAQAFPVEDAPVRLAYAQGASLVDEVIDTYGTDAIARLAEAYRDGATDDDAFEAATGVPLEALVERWFAELGQEVPQPIEPEPLLPAEDAPPENETQPPDAPGTDGAEPEPTPGPERPADDGAAGLPIALVAAVVLVLAGIAAVGVIFLRRARGPAAPGRSGHR